MTDVDLQLAHQRARETADTRQRIEALRRAARLVNGPTTQIQDDVFCEIRLSLRAAAAELERSIQ
jgi:hypothetical protein